MKMKMPKKLKRKMIFYKFIREGWRLIQILTLNKVGYKIYQKANFQSVQNNRGILNSLRENFMKNNI